MFFNCYDFISLLLIQQEDEDGQIAVLTIAEELMQKAGDIYLEQFARLGIFCKVQQLALTNETEKITHNDQSTPVGTGEIASDNGSEQNNSGERK